jgi:hypothetical protein
MNNSIRKVRKVVKALLEDPVASEVVVVLAALAFRLTSPGLEDFSSLILAIPTRFEGA